MEEKSDGVTIGHVVGRSDEGIRRLQIVIVIDDYTPGLAARRRHGYECERESAPLPATSALASPAPKTTSITAVTLRAAASPLNPSPICDPSTCNRTVLITTITFAVTAPGVQARQSVPVQSPNVKFLLQASALRKGQEQREEREARRSE